MAGGRLEPSPHDDIVIDRRAGVGFDGVGEIVGGIDVMGQHEVGAVDDLFDRHGLVDARACDDHSYFKVEGAAHRDEGRADTYAAGGTQLPRLGVGEVVGGICDILRKDVACAVDDAHDSCFPGDTGASHRHPHRHPGGAWDSDHLTRDGRRRSCPPVLTLGVEVDIPDLAGAGAELEKGAVSFVGGGGCEGDEEALGGKIDRGLGLRGVVLVDDLRHISPAERHSGIRGAAGVVDGVVCVVRQVWRPALPVAVLELWPIDAEVALLQPIEDHFVVGIVGLWLSIVGILGSACFALGPVSRAPVGPRVGPVIGHGILRGTQQGGSGE